jgi:lipopolysaccharide biosynthesis regulator YciM
MQKSVHQPLPCALDKLKRFAEQKPDNPLANFYYAVALWKKARRNPDVVESQRIDSLLARAISLDPKFAEAYLQRGMLYSGQTDFAKAVAAYEKAIQANPRLSEAHYELGLAYKRVGRDADARREFQAYAQVQKANTEAAEQRRREIRQFVIALADHSQAASQH